jgi:hypothetical protein
MMVGSRYRTEDEIPPVRSFFFNQLLPFPDQYQTFPENCESSQYLLVFTASEFLTSLMSPRSAHMRKLHVVAMAATERNKTETVTTQ